jgi:hypothetical protein
MVPPAALRETAVPKISCQRVCCSPFAWTKDADELLLAEIRPSKH